jgi:hypothetical protein
MMKVDYSNYSLLNIFRLSWAFISKNPSSLLEIIFYRIAILIFLYPFVFIFGIIVFIVCVLVIGLFTVNFFKFLPDTKLLILILAIPLGFIIAFAPILANGVVEAAVFQKYSYPDRKQVSVILTYFQTLFSAILNAFSIDYLVAIIAIIAVSLLSTQLSLVLGSIIAIYLIFVTIIRIARVAVLPYAKFLSDVEDDKHFAYIKAIPFDMICVMFFYNMILSNILNTILVFFKTEKEYLFTAFMVKGVQFEHVLAFAVFVLATSLTAVVQVVYYDVRDKLNFTRSTKLFKSILIGIAILVSIVLLVLPFASTLSNLKDYQKDYAKYEIAFKLKNTLEKGEGRLYTIISRFIKDKNADGVLNEEDLSEKMRETYEEALKLDLSKYE